jgi:dipeptidyl aminopeptidase/acylaminoacyl peptidase
MHLKRTLNAHTHIRRLAAAIGVAAASVLGSACSTAPTHPNLVTAQQSLALAPLVPVDAVGGFVISPNGRRLLWSQAVGTDVGLAVRDVAQPGTSAVTYPTGNQGRGSGLYTWLPDNRHVLYSKDPIGDENIQLLVLDAQKSGFAPWLVTPWRGSRSLYLGRGAPDSGRFFFSNNQRDKSTFDLYEADALARSVREVARSDGSVVAWHLGQDRQLAARTRKLGTQESADTVIEWRDADNNWRALKTVGSFDSYWIQRIDVSANKAWVLSNLGRDKTALLEVDLNSGLERMLATHDVVDLSYAVFANSQDGAGGPVGYVADPGLPQITYLDAPLEQDVQTAVSKALAAGLIKEPPVIARPSGFSQDNQSMVLRVTGHFDSAELLVQRKTGEVMRLNNINGDAQQLLAKQEPFSFSASDGRTIHGYVIRPRGVQGAAPLVLNIHGGPTARDYWSPAGFNTLQLLANRGYAVMLLNYRGSSGYGREHIWAGAREYYGRMQQDMAEGVQWAIDQGIADPKRLAVMGGSFGGFSTLAQLIQKPHDYRCGINIVGVANWPRAIESFPPYWRYSRIYTNRMYGDINKPEERAQIMANSPISHIDKITVPLLVVHGANDVRVIKQDSDDVVAALKGLGRPVEYMVFNDEGHSISKWRNRLALSRKIEDSLAACLGGRSNGFDFYELMPRN